MSGEGSLARAPTVLSWDHPGPDAPMVPRGRSAGKPGLIWRLVQGWPVLFRTRTWEKGGALLLTLPGQPELTYPNLGFLTQSENSLGLGSFTCFVTKEPKK